MTTDYADDTDGKKAGRKLSVKSVKSVVKSAGMKHEELTKDIIGSAMAVLNELKPGLDEKLCENALVIERVERGHKVEPQREYPVHYKGHFIGKLIPDLIERGWTPIPGGRVGKRFVHQEVSLEPEPASVVFPFYPC